MPPDHTRHAQRFFLKVSNTADVHYFETFRQQLGSESGGTPYYKGALNKWQSDSFETTTNKKKPGYLNPELTG